MIPDVVEAAWRQTPRACFRRLRAAAPWRAPLVLTGLSVFVALARFRTYEEPFERDITTYAVIGHELLSGRCLYSDLWDIKPPGVFIAYAAAEWLAGYGPRAVYLLNVGAALCSMLGVYFAASAEGRSRCGLWAATAFAILSGNLGLQANQPNAEALINACVVWACAFLLRAPVHLRTRDAIGLGALLFLASFFKTYAAVTSLLLLAHVLGPSNGTSRRAALRASVRVAGTVLAGWFSVFAYFGMTHRLGALYDVLFVYGRYYARGFLDDTLTGLFASERSLLLLCGVLGSALLGWVFGGAAQKRTWLLLGTYGIAAHVMVCLPGKFFPHYEQLWLPVVAVAFGRLLGDIRASRSSSPGWSRVSTALGGLAVSWLLYTHLPVLALTPDDWSRRKYGETFVLVRALSLDFKTLLLPEETFVQVGPESGLYFYTHRSPPAGPLIARHYLSGPLRDQLQALVLRDLERREPELIVVAPSHLEGSLASPSDAPVLRWITARYGMPASEAAVRASFPRFFERLGDQETPFLFFMRKGGALEARVMARSAAIAPR